MADWKLKKEDGSEYGPVSLDELANWARAGRVAPEDEVAEEGKDWKPAPSVPELAMEYTVTLTDGSAYGPLTLDAVLNLLEEGYIQLSAPVSRGSDRRAATLREWLAASPPAAGNTSPDEAGEAPDRERQAWAEERARLEQQVQDQAREITHWKKLYEQADESLKSVRRRAAERASPSAAPTPAEKPDRPRRSSPKQAPQNYSTSYIYASRHRMDRSDDLKEDR